MSTDRAPADLASMERLELAVRAALEGTPAVLATGPIAPCAGGECAHRQLHRAGEGRRARHCTGRRLAREGLRALGGPDVEVGRDPHGCPEWPAGFSGSISHGDALSAALVARRAEVASVGIDLERAGRFGADLWPSVFAPAELSLLLGLRGREERARVATVLFSAKEAVQKARYSDAGAWSDLRHVTVSLDLDRQRFRAGGGDRETGLFRTEGDLVFTASFVWADSPLGRAERRGAGPVPQRDAARRP